MRKLFKSRNTRIFSEVDMISTTDCNGKINMVMLFVVLYPNLLDEKGKLQMQKKYLIIVNA